VTNAISEVVLGLFLAHVAWPRAQLLGKCFAEVFIGN